MQTAKVPAAESDLLVIWHHVERIHYVSEGRRRFIVLTYDDGSTKNLAPHQARSLWYEVEKHKPCAAPCYWRYEVDTAPTACMDCQLAQMLEGIDVEVRPDRVRPRFRGMSWRTLAIAVPWAILLLWLLSMGGQNRGGAPAPPTSPPTNYPPKIPYTTPRGTPESGGGGVLR